MHKIYILYIHNIYIYIYIYADMLYVYIYRISHFYVFSKSFIVIHII